MWRLPGLFGPFFRAAVALICVAAVAGCGGGGHAEVIVDDGPPPVEPLSIVLTRVGPEAIEIEWSDDPYVERFVVYRDGYALADVDALSIVDASVYVDERYCYQVSGYRSGVLVAASDTACIVLLP